MESSQDTNNPVAWIQPNHLQQARIAPFLCRVEPSSRADFVPLYTAPPKSQPLTDEGINEIADSMPGGLAGFMKGWGWQQFARAIERAILERSNG